MRHEQKWPVALAGANAAGELEPLNSSDLFQCAIDTMLYVLREAYHAGHTPESAPEAVAEARRWFARAVYYGGLHATLIALLTAGPEGSVE